jgi:hypothetical protein
LPSPETKKRDSASQQTPALTTGYHAHTPPTKPENTRGNEVQGEAEGGGGEDKGEGEVCVIQSSACLFLPDDHSPSEEAEVKNLSSLASSLDPKYAERHELLGFIDIGNISILEEYYQISRTPSDHAHSHVHSRAHARSISRTCSVIGSHSHHSQGAHSVLGQGSLTLHDALLKATPSPCRSLEYGAEESEKILGEEGEGVDEVFSDGVSDESSDSSEADLDTDICASPPQTRGVRSLFASFAQFGRRMSAPTLLRNTPSSSSTSQTRKHTRTYTPSGPSDSRAYHQSANIDTTTFASGSPSDLSLPRQHLMLHSPGKIPSRSRRHTDSGQAQTRAVWPPKRKSTTALDTENKEGK